MSKYKDAMGRYRTESLFKETIRSGVKENGYAPVFTLSPENHPDGTPSLRQLYIAFGDITEYRFATEVLGSWTHWLRLQECAWFAPHLDNWRKELAVKLKQEAIDRLRNIANDPLNKQSAAAAKWLAEGRFNEKAGKRGRPTKAEALSALKEEMQVTKDSLQDAELLGLKVDQTNPN